MTMTVEKALLNNQSILQNFGLVEEIDEQAAEIISGGYITIKNTTNQPITYSIDGVSTVIKSGATQKIVTQLDGELRFDRDIRDEKVRVRDYDLEDGKTYEFRPDTAKKDFWIDIYGEGGDCD
ncbi:hypothetical protein GTQ43_08025 [Nostoc sp. KVJ3]|uniref:hypothetical protein n=1 Tax=Nostoc sp. KVJ3 TaxID=457945 RepID=UPI0022389F3B|nr:hypothetical protein [Nostoc sp. KVJ3]MCW5313753.1 hypothetical protein [Nostoc sp. KVJ3]